MQSLTGGEKPCLAPCMRCGKMVRDDADFCPDCGTLRIDHIHCVNHPAVEAVGACVICGKSLCAMCGGYSVGRFLCKQHAPQKF